jgi:hypothetical protein
MRHAAASQVHQAHIAAKTRLAHVRNNFATSTSSRKSEGSRRAHQPGERHFCGVAPQDAEVQAVPEEQDARVLAQKHGGELAEAQQVEQEEAVAAGADADAHVVAGQEPREDQARG